MKRFALALVAGALGLACSSTPAVIPTKNMDRPTDLTFVCLGITPDGLLSGQPMSACHNRNEADPAVTANGQRILGTFAFVPNATRGELAVGDMELGRLLDLTPDAPGYGMLPIGGDPESVASTTDGCWVATANRATCDVSLVDPSRLLAATFAKGGVAATPVTGASTTTSQRLKVVSGAAKRPLQAALGEIAFLPSATSGTCAGSDGARAVATFPGCDMVALLDLSFSNATATIASAFYVRPDSAGGIQAAGNEPVCPVDCATTDTVTQVAATSDDGGAQAGGSADGGASLDGGVLDAGTAGASSRLQALTLVPGGNRVYVGALRDTAVTSLDITDAGLANPARFQLAENPVGVNRLRLSVDPYAGPTGQFLSARGGEFLYAFTADDSVRVVDIGATPAVECDVNVVSTDVPSSEVTAACFPIGKYRRRALAQGPGLRIPSLSNPDSPPPLPRDIAFADLQPVSNTNPHALSGQFGFLLASDGQVYVIDLAPIGTDVDGGVYESQTSTHSFRAVRDVGNSVPNPLTVSIAPQRLVVAADQAFATTASFAASEGPTIPSFVQNGTQTWTGFPDPRSIISRTWDVVWEGALPDTSRDTGLVTSGNDSSAGVLTDTGADFCASGVQPGDVLMFSGCVLDTDCQPDNLFHCQVTVSGGRGICLPKDSTASRDLLRQESCARFMGSRMRYEVAQVGPTSLLLNLKRDEVPKTRLNPCQVDVDCRPDADHGSVAVPAAADGGVPHAFQCLEVAPNDRRCVERCGADSDCRAGNMCVSGLCMEAPPLDANCFPQPMNRYSVRAGNGYVVTGNLLPRPRTSYSNGTSCAVDPKANVELVNRIPFTAPQCPDTITAVANIPGAVQGIPAYSLPAGSNPCLFSSGTRTDSHGSTSPIVSAYFENPQVRFVLTNLDQYAGDLLSIHFEFQYGFLPETVAEPRYEVLLTMPTRILTGPTMTLDSPIRRNAGAVTYPYIYVMDQGRTALTPASRGQVLRINPRSGSTETTAFDTAISGSTPFQLQ